MLVVLHDMVVAFWPFFKSDLAFFSSRSSSSSSSSRSSSMAKVHKGLLERES
jgi:hypothetical protein